jgi:hypothetical protein
MSITAKPFLGEGRDHAETAGITANQPRFTVIALRFTVNPDRFTVNPDRFTVNPDRFTVNPNRFTVIPDRFTVIPDRLAAIRLGLSPPPRQEVLGQGDSDLHLERM